jgi:hypothetical protein
LSFYSAISQPPVIMMSLKVGTALIMGLFLVATATFVLPTAAASGVRRNMVEQAESDLDAQFNQEKPTARPDEPLPERCPTASPTPTPVAWKYGAAGQSCDQVCAAAGGSCNVDAQNAVDTIRECEYVVYTALAGQGLPVAPCAGSTSQANPLFETSQTTYFFNPALGIAGTCESSFPQEFRICCCGETAECPTA